MQLLVSSLPIRTTNRRLYLWVRKDTESVDNAYYIVDILYTKKEAKEVIDSGGTVIEYGYIKQLKKEV